MRETWDCMTAEEQNDVLQLLEVTFRQTGMRETLRAVDDLRVAWAQAELRSIQRRPRPNPDVYAEVVP